MRAVPAALALIALAAHLATARPVHDMEKLVAERPIGDAPVRIDEIERTAQASVHLIQVRGEVPPNYHERHDEWVLLWRGAGNLRLGDKEGIELAPGSWTMIPRGTVHGFTNTGAEPAVVLAMFLPPFDGKDRVNVADPKPATPEPR